MTIPPDVRKVYEEAREAGQKGFLIGAYTVLCKEAADALQWAIAEALKLEFWRYHDEHDPEDCLECDTVKTVDDVDLAERHDWTEANWLAEADRRLMEPVE